jgi:quinoprotein glucose dehydrogenase
MDQFSLNKIDGFDKKSIEDSLKSMDYGQLFIPPGVKPTMVFPQFNGGTDWGGAAYDRNDRMIYVNCSNEAEWFAMINLLEGKKVSLYNYGKQLFNTNCIACHNNSNIGLRASINNFSVADKERIKKSIYNGKGLMPAFKSLDGDELNALSSFILKTGKEEIIKVENSDKIFEIPWVANGHPGLKTKNGYPINDMPWGTLTGIDLDLGEIKWQVPLGTYPELEKKGLSPTGTFNMGGPIVTAGGLIFIGATMDERFRAFDKKDGSLMWEYQLEAGGYATPSTFQVGGKQFVIIAGGGLGKPGTKGGNKLYCFGL